MYILSKMIKKWVYKQVRDNPEERQIKYEFQPRTERP